MDNFVDERDYRLLESDRYTFFVLGRILKGKCDLILSDHERLIICFSCAPFPVWIWTPDDATDDELANEYKIVAEQGLLDGKHSFNVKYKLAEYFISKTKDTLLNLRIKTNMFAYDCPQVKEPSTVAKGDIYKLTEADEDELVDFTEAFHNELKLDQRDRKFYRESAKADIESGKIFFWKNDKGENVASCKYRVDDGLGCISLVYTRPEHRRGHYAENLVSKVSQIAAAEGLTPMLYTDADYVASNACYEKIGYIRRGELCTIG